MRLPALFPAPRSNLGFRAIEVSFGLLGGGFDRGFRSGHNGWVIHDACAGCRAGGQCV